MVLSSLTIALWSGGLITGWWLSRFLRGRGSDSNRLPLPPGPKGYPIIDNLLDMPTDKSWQTFDKWSKTYGMSCTDQNPIYSLRPTHRRYGIFQDTWPTISCPRERRKDLWSIWETLIQLLWPSTFPHVQWNVRRLFSIYVGTRSLESRMDFTWNMAFRQYGSQWRNHRRAFHDYFHPNIVHKYHSAQITTIRTFLRCLLKSPDDFMHHIRQWVSIVRNQSNVWIQFTYTSAFTSTILKLTYGMNIPEDDDSEYVKIAEIVMAALAETGHLGSFLVDLFPSMKHIPAWFPGAGWKRKANTWRELGEYFAHMPWVTVREQLVGYILLIFGRVLTFRTETRYSWTLHCSQSHREITGRNITWSHWRRGNGSQYMRSCFCWWVFPPSSKSRSNSKASCNRRGRYSKSDYAAVVDLP